MRLIERVWYENHPLKWLLLPLSALFFLLSGVRRLLFKLGVLSVPAAELPVVVVGNIGVGGNGKTPVVVFLAEQLTQRGFKVGVVSRGYGSKAPNYPYLVSNKDDACVVGDEPTLIVKRTQVPLVISPDRVAGVSLLKKQGCNVVIADDGLQHYRLARAVELIVIDGKRQFGNGCLLPAGPLREGKWRLKTVDAVINNGGINLDKRQIPMTLTAKELVNIVTGERISIALFLQQTQVINAIAGIGSPERFYSTLTTLGFTIKTHQDFIDHHQFSGHDLIKFEQDIPLIMTEKDAVKCQTFGQANYWYLPVSATFEDNDSEKLLTIIEQRVKQYGV